MEVLPTNLLMSLMVMQMSMKNICYLCLIIQRYKYTVQANIVKKKLVAKEVYFILCVTRHNFSDKFNEQ